jgi:hypothetical protein
MMQDPIRIRFVEGSFLSDGADNWLVQGINIEGVNVAAPTMRKAVVTAAKALGEVSELRGPVEIEVEHSDPEREDQLLRGEFVPTKARWGLARFLGPEIRIHSFTNLE